jgi:hypothetical protein
LKEKEIGSGFCIQTAPHTLYLSTGAMVAPTPDFGTGAEEQDSDGVPLDTSIGWDRGVTVASSGQLHGDGVSTPS